MRKAILIASFFLLPLFSGCAASDVLFNIFGDHYTDGGYTDAERRHDYNQKVDAAQEYSAY